MNQCLSYPTSSTFGRVTGLCNRPLTKKDAYLPDDDRLEIVPGIDLTGSVDAVAEQLKAKVKAVETVDVVFFCGEFTLVSVMHEFLNFSSNMPQHTFRQTISSP